MDWNISDHCSLFQQLMAAFDNQNDILTFFNTEYHLLHETRTSEKLF